MDAYKNIEAILLDDIAPFLGVRAADPVVIANQMMQRGLINQATFDLFQTLRRARNVAAHIAPGRITSQEAIDYGDHATTLRFRFSYALGRLRGEGEHKPKE